MKPKYMKSVYQYFVNHIITLTLIPIMVSILVHLGPDGILNLWNSLIQYFDLIKTLCSAFLIIFISTLYFMSKPPTIYLVDYACFKPPATCRVPSSVFVKQVNHVQSKKQESLDFQKKILERSGLGEETCWPPSLVQHSPPKRTMEGAREEAELVIFSAMDSLFKNTKLNPKDIDILVVNCSVFCPTPSLCSMVINKYKLRSNIKSFNLSGMGCSASLISIDLAKDLLQVDPNSNIAVIVSTEILSRNFYLGNEKSMLLTDCLFRMGGAAILLSNKKSDYQRAKYKLIHVVRTHNGADDKAYRCVYEEEDKEGEVGVSLSKHLVGIAGEALKKNITTIAPLVLPVSEKLLFLATLIGKKMNPKWKNYVPDFKLAVEHFCIHAGGRGVIDGIQKSLQLSSEHVEAARMTLHRFGNTSSSSLWYELNYIESKGRMKRGDRIWQLGFGSGFKCNSAVWKCNRNIMTPLNGPWEDCIHRYPIHIPDIAKL